MSTLETIPVEIFRDVDYPDIDTSIGFDGVNLVNVFAKNLEVVKASRKLGITQKDPSTVSADFLNFPQLDSPLNILLTRKRIGYVQTDDHTTREDIGFARKLQWKDQSIAVINVNAAEPKLITSHEIGHMLNLNYPKQSDSTHCTIEDCIMHATRTSRTTKERVKKKGIPAILERHGYRPAEYKEFTTVSGTSFCTSCIEQLSRRSFFLLQHLQGKKIPEEWR